MNTDDAHTAMEDSKESFIRDISDLSFEGTRVIGKHGLVTIDLQTGKMFIRRKPSLKPFCYINLPTKKGSDMQEALSSSLMHPKLKGWGDLDGMDDLTSTLWAFINIRHSEKPIDLRGITLSPEAAELFAKTF
jgi:hypothetical protein